MIKPPFIKNFSVNYLELFPRLKEEKAQAFTTLALTFIALSFFGVFAINPTITTITHLHKELEDNEHVNNELQKKINNLGTLQRRYLQLETMLPLIYAALPQTPNATLLAGQLQSIANTSSVTVSKLQVFEVSLTPQQTPAKPRTRPTEQKDGSFNFLIEVIGTTTNLFSFLDTAVTFERLVTLDSVSLGTDPLLTGVHKLNIRGKAYFKP